MRPIAVTTLLTFTAATHISCGSDDDSGGTTDESMTSSDGNGGPDESPVGGDDPNNAASGGSDNGGTDAGTGGSIGTEDPPETSEPNAATCADQEDWNPAWIALEDEILTIVNERRAAGASCGGEQFAPSDPLIMDEALRCASRLHSKDMADQDYFDHHSLDGRSPWDRIDAAGFEHSAGGENIAAGTPTAEETMEGWMNSPGHCSNIMNPNFDFIGVGYYPGGGYGHMWTQTFGSEGGWR